MAEWALVPAFHARVVEQVIARLKINNRLLHELVLATQRAFISPAVHDWHVSCNLF